MRMRTMETAWEWQITSSGAAAQWKEKGFQSSLLDTATVLFAWTDGDGWHSPMPTIRVRDWNPEFFRFYHALEMKKQWRMDRWPPFLKLFAREGGTHMKTYLFEWIGRFSLRRESPDQFRWLARFLHFHGYDSSFFVFRLTGRGFHSSCWLR